MEKETIRNERERQKNETILLKRRKHEGKHVEIEINIYGYDW